MAMPGRSRNVKQKRFGATGDGSTDDTAAIQKAINDGGPTATHGTVEFPIGLYRISAPLLFEAATLNIRFVGEPGAKLITDTIADAILKRSVNSPIGGVHVIENLIFENNHPQGKCVLLHSCVTAKVANCQFGGGAIGIETYNSQCATLDTCAFIGHKSVGVMAGNATTLLDCDITGCGMGVRHQNVGLVVHGGRFEVNQTGIGIGLNEKEPPGPFQTAGFDISGLSMEANQTGILVGPGAAGKISACSISGGVRMEYGLRMVSPQDVVVAGVSVGGSQGFAKAGIAVEAATRVVMMGVSSNSPVAWALPSDRSNLTLIQCNNP